MKNIGFLIVFLISLQSSLATTEKDSIEKWSYHFQFTGIMQGHPSFNVLYSGANSLSNNKEDAFSVTSTFYFGRKLWKGASFYFNPEIAGGKGISSALGIAGFTNGECFRIGDPAPALYVARAFLRQNISLNQDHKERLDADLNQLGKEEVANSRITITLGHFSIADVFDDNSYSHDPRTQFMNWALMSNGAWDYPANTRGYTNGIILELIQPKWALRLSESMVPTLANGHVMDEHISKARGETLELEKNLLINKHNGAVKLLFFRNLSRAGNYEQAVDLYTSGLDSSLNVNSLTKYGAQKYGFGLNAEQEITSNLGLFLKASWNDGKTATWVFTEIDQSASIGFILKGKHWKRPDDAFGLAGVMNGISAQHIDFLDHGGYGFIIGDGKLKHYGYESILETFYNCKLTKTCWISADYQFVNNPAYNKDRGPVHVWGIRGHFEI